MAETGKRCDCELSMDEATKGDLPAVCVWCGEAAELVSTPPFEYQSQRVILRLPLCRRHKNRWYRSGQPRLGFLTGAVLVAFGVLLGSASSALVKSDERGGLVFLGALLAVFGLSALCVSLFTYMRQGTRAVEVARLSLGGVRLANVAPEFIEAHRAYRLERADFAVSPPPAETLTAQRGVTGPDSAWGEEALQVLEVAGLEARGLGHDHIGTKHLLIALRRTTTTARNALQALGLETEQFREVCRAAAPPSPTLPPTADVPSTPALRRVLSRAAEEARAFGHSSVRAGHLLLALLRDPENEAVQLLLDLGLSPEEVTRRAAEAVRHLEGVMAAEARQGITPKGGGQ